MNNRSRRKAVVGLSVSRFFKSHTWGRAVHVSAYVKSSTQNHNFVFKSIYSTDFYFLWRFSNLPRFSKLWRKLNEDVNGILRLRWLASRLSSGPALSTIILNNTSTVWSISFPFSALRCETTVTQEKSALLGGFGENWVSCTAHTHSRCHADFESILYQILADLATGKSPRQLIKHLFARANFLGSIELSPILVNHNLRN